MSNLRTLIVLLALLGLVPASHQAHALERTVYLHQPDGEIILASLGPAAVLEGAHAGHLLHMDLKRLLALTSGVAIGNFVVHSLVGGQLYLIGLLGGAMIGEWWYEENIWPFNREEQKKEPWWKVW